MYKLHLHTSHDKSSGELIALLWFSWVSSAWHADQLPAVGQSVENETV